MAVGNEKAIKQRHALHEQCGSSHYVARWDKLKNESLKGGGPCMRPRDGRVVCRRAAAFSNRVFLRHPPSPSPSECTYA